MITWGNRELDALKNRQFAPPHYPDSGCYVHCHDNRCLGHTILEASAQLWAKSKAFAELDTSPLIIRHRSGLPWAVTPCFLPNLEAPKPEEMHYDLWGVEKMMIWPPGLQPVGATLALRFFSLPNTHLLPQLLLGCPNHISTLKISLKLPLGTHVPG